VSLAALGRGRPDLPGKPLPALSQHPTLRGERKLRGVPRGGNAGLRAHGPLAETAAILRNILSAVYYPQEFDALGSRMLGEEGAL
jgi:hypothetical protein